MKKVSIIGTGLIGASLAIKIKERNLCQNICGFDSSQKNARTALKKGIINEVLPLDDVVESADLIVVAVPADEALHVIPKILDSIEKQIVFDVGSVKMPLALKVDNHPKRENFVSTHPMWGTEFSGPQHATSKSFESKRVILCDVEKSSKEAVAKVKTLYQNIGMLVEEMNTKEHDEHAAYISHISHITSFVLSLAVLSKEKDKNKILTMASGGFESTVRLAKSSAKMWSPIFVQNKEMVLQVMKEYQYFMSKFEKAIFDEDKDKLSELIKEANKIRKVLDK